MVGLQVIVVLLGGGFGGVVPLCICKEGDPTLPNKNGEDED